MMTRTKSPRLTYAKKIKLAKANTKRLTGHETFPPKLLWNIKEVAAALGVGVRTIWNLLNKREIPKPIRLRRRVCWRVADINEWVANHRSQP